MGTTTHSPPEVIVALQGTLDTFALPDVLRLLAATKKTGRLRITGGRGTGSVWVNAGEVEAIEATHAPHATEAGRRALRAAPLRGGCLHLRRRGPPRRTRPADGRRDPARLSPRRCSPSGATSRPSCPSMDAWVTLRKHAARMPEIALDQERWTTIVAIGGGATVRRIGDELCLAELPISRAVKDLAEVGLVDIAAAAAGGRSAACRPPAAPLSARPPRWRRRPRRRRSEVDRCGAAAAERAASPPGQGGQLRSGRARGLRAPRPARHRRDASYDNDGPTAAEDESDRR